MLKLTLLVFFLGIGMAKTQTKFVREIHPENNWDQYQETWYKETLAELSQTNQIRKEAKNV